LTFKIHQEKAVAVNAIKKDSHTVLVDATQPYPDVLLDIKKQIWDSIK